MGYRFSEWVNREYPTFEDKLNACISELVSAGETVDIDVLNSVLARGTNKGKRVATLSKESRSRCRIHVNEKPFEDIEFPHIVFVNQRMKYVDGQGKCIPAVVDTVPLLFERYKTKNTSPASTSSLVINRKVDEVDQTKLINEQRAWFAQLKPYSNASKNKYFSKKGIYQQKIIESASRLNFKNGYSPRYGLYTAIPLQRLYNDTFSGFQRIYESGDKIFVADFNPSGLCAVFECNAKTQPVKNVIFHEGVANALLANFMCQEMGVTNTLNIACLFADNIPLVVQDLNGNFNAQLNALCIYDNDVSMKGKLCAEAAQKVYPMLKIDCFEVNDLAAMVDSYGYKNARHRLKEILMSAFRKD